MISKELVTQLVEERIANTDLFWVSIDIRANNLIRIVLDGDQGVSINQCISVSRNVEHNLDREVEDFSLEVTSFGLSQAFVLERQFLKYIGKNIEVTTEDDKKVIGTLLSYSPEAIELKLELSKKQIKAGVEENIRMDFSDIKEVKSVISFK